MNTNRTLKWLKEHNQLVERRLEQLLEQGYLLCDLSLRIDFDEQGELLMKTTTIVHTPSGIPLTTVN